MDVPDGGRAREQPPAGPQAACVIVGVCGNFFFTKCLATTFPAPRAPSAGPGGAAQLRPSAPGVPYPAPPRSRQHAPLRRAIDGRNVPLFADVHFTSRTESPGPFLRSISPTPHTRHTHSVTLRPRLYTHFANWRCKLPPSRFPAQTCVSMNSIRHYHNIDDLDGPKLSGHMVLENQSGSTFVSNTFGRYTILESN